MQSPSPYDEKVLLLLVAEGDEKAFTKLVDIYWNKVYSHALAYSKSSPTAQEITQDVFLKIWNKRDSLRDVQDFKNFLFISGRNMIVSALRKKLGETVGSYTLTTPEDVLIPDLQLDFKQTHTTILEAIEKLPPTRKAVFKMSRVEGLSYEEIATKLNISRNTVKQHIVLALNFLRTYLYINNNLIIVLLFSLLFL